MLVRHKAWNANKATIMRTRYQSPYRKAIAISVNCVGIQY